MADLHVDAAGLRALSAEIGGASTGLTAARDTLAHVDACLQRGAVLDQATGADHKIHTFARQFRSEFDLIDQLLSAFSSVLDDAASAYEDLEAGIVATLQEC